MQYRQGDVFLEKIKSVPKDFKLQSNNPIVAYSEVTSHHHTIVLEKSELSVKMFVNAQGKIVYNIPCNAKIIHQEHAEIKLPAGIYFYIPQREYSPKAIKRVID